MSIAENNPGGIEYVVSSPAHPGTSNLIGCTGSDGHGKCVFDTDEHGLRAIASVLNTYHLRFGADTVRLLVSRLSQSNVSSYVSDVCKRTGFGADQHLDMGHGDTYRNLLQAIIWHQNGKQPYPTALIWDAVDNALGFNFTGER